MLTDVELQQFLDRAGLSAQARQIVANVRASPPSRRVQSGMKNVSCRYTSRKMGMVIQAESHTNELAAVYGWEHDDRTHEFYDQPPRIKLAYRAVNGRTVAYLATPDYFLLQEDFVGWVECKTEEWLQTKAAAGSTMYVRDEAGRWRCPPGEAYAASFGLSFRVRSSAETNWAQVRNLSLLSDYLDERCPEPLPEQVRQVKGLFETQAWLPLQRLLQNPAEIASDTVFKMIADGLLVVDLSAQLLSEPERTLVFRDSSSAQAHRACTASQHSPVRLPIHCIQLVSGEPVIWDGKPWRILNAGVQEVFLEGPDHGVTHLSRDAFEQLVRDGAIRGAPAAEDNRWHDSEHVLRQASPGDIERAVFRYQCLFPETPEATPSVSERSLRLWRARFREGVDRYGAGFIGLLPMLHKRGNRNRKVDNAVIDLMQQAIQEIYEGAEQRSVTYCYGHLQNLCQERHLLAPSEKTLRAEIRRRRLHALTESRRGTRAAYRYEEFYWVLNRSTPRHGERPFEIGHIDHTELDVDFVGRRFGEPLRRAWLTVLLDAFTRTVLAFVLTFDPPSYRSCMAVIQECVRRHNRIPKTLVVDKGPEFSSVYFESLLARLEVHKKTRPTQKPRFGSVIERFFGLLNTEFLHNLAGNSQALQTPREMSPSHDPRTRAVWTLADFHDAFARFVDEVYANLEHPALGVSPGTALRIGLEQSGMRAHMLIPYTPDFVLLCLPSTPKGTATVEVTRGVKIGYVYYWTPEFRDPGLVGQSVPVRYDPFDISKAFVYLRDHWAECRSEYAADFQNHSEREIRIVTQEIRSRLKQSGERRAVNAAAIAAYLRCAAASEEVLAQRKRDQERQLVHENTLALAPPTALAASPHDEPAAHDSWSNLTLTLFGDFE